MAERAQLRSLLNTIPDLVWLKDPQGVYLACNPTFEKLVGMPEAALVGKTDEDLFAAEVASSFRAYDQQVTLTGKPTTNEEWLTFAADGRRILVETIKTPSFDEEGKLVGVLGVARDITERKLAFDTVTKRFQAEQALYLMSDTQRQIARLENLDEIYHLVGQKIHELLGDGYTVTSRLDEAAQVMRLAGVFGISHHIEALIRRFKIDPFKMEYALADMTPEELRIFRSGRLEKFEDGLYAMFTRKVPQSVCQIVEKQLQIKAIYTMGFVWHGRHFGGLVILAKRDLAPFQDIIETIMNQASIAIKRLVSEAALRESEERLRLFIDHAPVALAMFDHEMRYVAVSNRWVADYELEELGIVGRSHYDIFPEIPERWKAVHRRGLAGEIIRAEEDEFVRYDGRSQWLRWEIRPWYTDSGAVGGIVIFSEDVTVRKETQEALRESQDILAEAESVAKMGSWKWDLVTNKATWSEGMFEIFAVDRENFDGNIDHLMASRIHPEDLPTATEAALATFKNYQPMLWQCRLLLPNGVVRDVVQEGRLSYGPDGRPTAVFGYVQDITERTQAEKALRESEERYHRTLDNMLEGCQILGFDWRYLYLNDSVVRHSRLNRKAMLGRKIMKVYPGIENTELFTILNHCMIERTPCSLENEFAYDDGTSAWFDLSIQPIPEGLFILSIDITERKQAEATIAQLNRRMELILNSAGEGIYGTDVDGRITFVNPAMAAMLGWEAAALLGQNAHNTFHHTRADGRAYPQHDCHIYQAMQTNSEHHAADDVFWHKDGSPIAVDYTSTLIREEGRVLGSVVVVKDITERKRAAAEQARLEDQLRQAQKMESIGRLAGGVAHDFNNQLSVIRLYGELMEADMGTASTSLPKLEQILKATEHAADLTRQLLAFSRKQVLQPVVLNLNDLVTNMHKMLARLIGEDISLTTILQPNLWRVTADASQLEQVIMNLAVNARDAMPTGGQLTLETRNCLTRERVQATHLEAPLGPCVMLAVSDTGHGMDEATKKQIFEPFFTTKPAGHGTGLGLATVYGIVKQSGGAIFVYSEPGQGTTFKIYLPANTSLIPESRPQPSGVSSGVGSETILLVEDEDALRELVRMTLQEMGYKVIEAGNGRQALSLVEQYTEPIDLLLTDVVMPQMGGRQLAETLTSQRPQLKVLFTSGYMDDAVVRHGLLTAEVEFLAKPFTHGDLAAKVREVLDR